MVSNQKGSTTVGGFAKTVPPHGSRRSRNLGMQIPREVSQLCSSQVPHDGLAVHDERRPAGRLGEDIGTVDARVDF